MSLVTPKLAQYIILSGTTFIGIFKENLCFVNPIDKSQIIRCDDRICSQNVCVMEGFVIKYAYRFGKLSIDDESFIAARIKQKSDEQGTPAEYEIFECHGGRISSNPEKSQAHFKGFVSIFYQPIGS